MQDMRHNLREEVDVGVESNEVLRSKYRFKMNFRRLQDILGFSCFRKWEEWPP